MLAVGLSFLLIVQLEGRKTLSHSVYVSCIGSSLRMVVLVCYAPLLGKEDDEIASFVGKVFSLTPQIRLHYAP